MRRLLPLLVLLPISLPVHAADWFSGALSVGVSRTTADNPWWPDQEFSGNHLRLTAQGTVAPWLGIEVGWSGLGSETIREVMHVMWPGGRIFHDVRYSGSVGWIGLTPGFRDDRHELVAKIGYSRVERKRQSFTFTDSGMMFGVGFARFGEGPWGFRLDYEKHDVARVFGVSATYRL